MSTMFFVACVVVSAMGGAALAVCILAIFNAGAEDEAHINQRIDRP